MSAADLEADGGRAGGMSAVGGSVIGGSSSSSFGASQLLLLSGSSQLLALAPPNFGQSTVGNLGASQAPQSTTALSAFSPSMHATVVAAAAASSEIRSQQLATDLYARLDHFYVSAPRSTADVEAGAQAQTNLPERSEAAVGDAGNYELTTCSTTAAGPGPGPGASGAETHMGPSLG